MDTTLSDRNARVIDADNDGDPNDEGAMWVWTPETGGETFRDATNGIAVQVTGATASGYSVRITLGS